jgi:hypothetical protein
MIKAEADFSVYRVCREYSAEAYARDAMNLLDERFADRGRWERTVASTSSTSRHALLHAGGLLRREPPPLLAPALVAPLARRRRAARRGGAGVRHARRSRRLPQRASTLELQWLLCRAAVRGVREPDVDPYWTAPAL